MDDDFKPRYKLKKSDIDITIDNDKTIKIEEAPEPGAVSTKPMSSKRKRLKLSKKHIWLIAGGAVAVLALVGVLIYALSSPKKSTADLTKPKSTVQSTPVTRSRLTGLPVTQAQYNLPVTGVMIENSDEARPQSGLSKAGVIFEALVEGGITRFLALYEEGQPGSIGPVRSARPFFVDAVLAFDAAYAHVGGSTDALNDISVLGVKDMDQFANGNYYQRITSRVAPHNVYTSMSSLLSLEQTKGWTSSNFTGFPRKNDQPSAHPTATSINFNLSYSDYNVHYDYNKTNNSYERSEAGAPMIDANTGQQLNPKVVIAIVVPASQGALDASGAYYVDYQDVGSGTAYIFQDGTVTQGTWSKSSAGSQILFGDANGDPIALNNGQTWITAVEATNQVVYSN